MPKTLQRGSDEYLRLVAYVVDQQPGAMLDYAQVEDATGVSMAEKKGRDKLRRAILRSGLEYAVEPKKGFHLAEPKTAMSILTFRLVRIDSQVRRADRAQRVIQGQFLVSLNDEEQKGVLFLGAVFGAIRMAAANGKRLYGTRRPELKGTAETIAVPNIGGNGE